MRLHWFVFKCAFGRDLFRRRDGGGCSARPSGGISAISGMAFPDPVPGIRSVLYLPIGTKIRRNPWWKTKKITFF